MSDEIVEGAFRRLRGWMPASAFPCPLLWTRPRESLVALGEFDTSDTTAEGDGGVALHDQFQGDAGGTQPRHRRVPRHVLAVRLPRVQYASPSGRHVPCLNLTRVAPGQLRLEPEEYTVRTTDQDVTVRTTDQDVTADCAVLARLCLDGTVTAFLCRADRPVFVRLVGGRVGSQLLG